MWLITHSELNIAMQVTSLLKRVVRQLQKWFLNFWKPELIQNFICQSCYFFTVLWSRNEVNVNKQVKWCNCMHIFLSHLLCILKISLWYCAIIHVMILLFFVKITKIINFWLCMINFLSPMNIFPTLSGTILVPKVLMDENLEFFGPVIYLWFFCTSSC